MRPYKGCTKEFCHTGVDLGHFYGVSRKICNFAISFHAGDRVGRGHIGVYQARVSYIRNLANSTLYGETWQQQTPTGVKYPVGDAPERKLRELRPLVYPRRGA